MTQNPKGLPRLLGLVETASSADDITRLLNRIKTVLPKKFVFHFRPPQLYRRPTISLSASRPPANQLLLNSEILQPPKLLLSNRHYAEVPTTYNLDVPAAQFYR